MRRFSVHPVNPQRRLMQQAADQLRGGAVVAMPTDACYVLACHLGDKAAVDRLRQIRAIDDKHLLTLMCRDLSELAQYAQVDNRQYRFLKEWTPGAYTFILPATKEVPRRLSHPSRKTVGLRVPASPIVQALLEALGEPVLSSTLILPGETEPLTEPEDIEHRLAKQIDLMIDGEPGRHEPTTVIDMTGDEPMVVRVGVGPIEQMTLGR
ncbi:MAG TPA: L-threonylcarbamoyladenylate synthase [Lautropia sp.]|jgi:tRNA threonylcarbamoyl adenosine modification protein (Sua5/YciO/YrdC/YwlC family)|nr:L-threonylcarbamoyladenylate synthase [Lautropia sp.]